MFTWINCIKNKIKTFKICYLNGCHDPVGRGAGTLPFVLQVTSPSSSSSTSSLVGQHFDETFFPSRALQRLSVRLPSVCLLSSLLTCSLRDSSQTVTIGAQCGPVYKTYVLSSSFDNMLTNVSFFLLLLPLGFHLSFPFNYFLKS